jgi:hypothetical protein
MSKNDTRIVIAQGGFVFIGEFSETSDYIKLCNARNIRVWGTKAGLGEIALRGPTKETVLDFAGIVDFPRGAVIAMLRCENDL